MQLELNLDIETVKKKTRAQKEEELRYLYSERLFHGNLERMSEMWNSPQDEAECRLAD